MLDRIVKLSDEVNGLRAEMKGIRFEISSSRPIEPHHSFFVRHMGLALTVAGWLIMLGIVYNRFQSLEAMFQKSEMHGSEFAREGIQENRSQIKFLDGRVSILEGDSKERNAAIQMLVSDMRLVRGWIDEQREKEKISKTSLVQPKP